jgi:hypothetical protein
MPVLACGIIAVSMAVAAFLESPLGGRPEVRGYATQIDGAMTTATQVGAAFFVSEAAALAVKSGPLVEGLLQRIHDGRSLSSVWSSRVPGN